MISKHVAELAWYAALVVLAGLTCFTVGYKTGFTDGAKRRQDEIEQFLRRRERQQR